MWRFARIPKRFRSVKDFIQKATKLLHILDLQDWYRISQIEIERIGGSVLLFHSLPDILVVQYPLHDWKFSKFQATQSKKSSQRYIDSFIFSHYTLLDN